MEILFLGTGAAEGIPSMGCTCTHCQRARQQGGQLRRDRSALLIRLASYHLLIDTPPYVRHLLEQHAITIDALRDEAARLERRFKRMTWLAFAGFVLAVAALVFAQQALRH